MNNADDQNTNYLNLDDYVVVRRDYHERLVACVERAELKLEQFKPYADPDEPKMQDRVKLLGFILATEDAL